VIRRGLGLALVLTFVLAFEPGDPAVANRVLLPAVAALGAWLVVDSLAAVALAVTVLAGIHSDPFSTDHVRSIVYPLAALGSGACSAIIFGRRFLRHVRDTRSARAASREARGNPREV